MPHKAPQNDQRDRAISLIIKAGGRCGWSTKVGSLNGGGFTLEGWILPRGLVILQAFKVGAEIYASDGVPAPWDQLEAWLAERPVRS